MKLPAWQVNEILYRFTRLMAPARLCVIYSNAIHSTEIKIPAGNGITCGVLRAGALAGKISAYTLFKTAKSLPVTINTVVFTIFIQATSRFFQYYFDV